MEEHAAQMRQMQGKVSTQKDDAKKAMEQRLAKRAQAKGNQVAPHTSIDIQPPSKSNNQARMAPMLDHDD